MTITHLDDEPLDTLHPLDLLERAVEANGWAFERAGSLKAIFPTQPPGRRCRSHRGGTERLG